MNDYLERGRPIASAALLVCALAIGGGGSSFPIAEMMVEIVAISLLGILAAGSFPVLDEHRPALILLALAAATPLAQLFPLPAGLWASLPGRALPVSIYGAAMLPLGPHAISLTPDATWRALLALLPGSAMLLATLQADERERGLLMGIVVAAALFSAVLGAVQVIGGAPWYAFGTAHLGNPVGLFASRNHQADLLMIGMVSVAALGARAARGRSGYVVAAAVAAATAGGLAVATIATTSRMGLLVLPVAAIGVVVLLLPPRKRVTVAIVAVLLVAAAAAVLLSNNAIAHRAALRLNAGGDVGRMGFWRDTLVAIRQFWPVGSGLGSFVPVFASVETLETVSPRYVNHAHNEYLELVLELGAWGIILIAGGFAILLRRLVSKPYPLGRADGFAGLMGVAILLLHSFVDFPLRTLSLSTVFGFSVGLIFSPARVLRMTRRYTVPKPYGR